MPNQIEFFFDIASPYSYLASTQIEWLENETGLPVDWRPFLLGGVFRDAGNEPPAKVENKAKYMHRDLQRWAHRYGIPLEFPSTFPLNSLLVQRVLLAVKRRGGEVSEVARRLFEAYWVRDSDISERSNLEPVLGEFAESAGELIEEAQSDPVKNDLIENSHEAVERGAFGAPTFFVGEEMFWGNDRLDFVREAAEEL